MTRVTVDYKVCKVYINPSHFIRETVFKILKMLTKPTFVCVCLLSLLVDGSLLSSFKNFWGKHETNEQTSESRGFSSRSSYNDHLEPYMSAASSRGWGWGGGGGGGGGGWGDDHQNLDLYSLLGGLSFASLLGATIIYLARRNTSGRRRRSADGLSYLEDDEMDFSEDPRTKGLNIVEMIDTFLDTNYMRDNNTKPVRIGPGIIPFDLYKLK